MPLPAREQEVDVWWGAYSMRALLPGVIVCVLGTGLLLGLYWLYVPRGNRQLLTVALLGFFWIVLLVLWARRVFGYNYRLTSQRLFVEKGIFWRVPWEVDLAQIGGVYVQRNPVQRRLGVGRILVIAPGAGKERVVLEGVVAPEEVAERLRHMARDAQEKDPGGVRAV